MKGTFNNISKDELQSLLDTSSSYKEVLEKVGLSAIGNNYNTLRKYINLYNLSTEIIDQSRRKRAFNTMGCNKDTFLDNLNAGKIKSKGNNILKKLVEFDFKVYRCEKCGISEWNNEPITLELHHKDGNHHNNKFDNLEILCPNCHSQTSTFRYKNKDKESRISCNICNKKITPNLSGLCFECYQKRNDWKPSNSKICPTCGVNFMRTESSMCQSCYTIYRVQNSKIYQKISRNDLKVAIRTSKISEIAREYGVDKKTICHWCDFYNLPHTKKDISSYDDDTWDKL